jgi:hypothetical protein
MRFGLLKLPKSPVREGRTLPLLAGREASILDKDVLATPEKGNSCQPILLLERFVGSGPCVGRKYSRHGRELRAGGFASYGAGSHSHPGIVPDALVLPRVAARHHVNLVIFFSKPDWGRHGGTASSQGRQADVFLAPNLQRDGHGPFYDPKSGGFPQLRCGRCTFAEHEGALSGLVRL